MDDPARPPAPRRSLIGLSLALVLAVAAVCAPVRGHEYLDYDDMALLVWNSDLDADSLGEALVIAFTRPQASGWVPLATLSHQLDRWLFGQRAGGPLIVNAALHALASVLLLWSL